MKKIVLLLTILIISSGANAQYRIFTFGKFEYKTDCHYNKNNFITIRMSLQSLDSYPVELIIGNKKQYDSFLKRLHLLKTKMLEWDSVCVNNGIDKIDKLIDFKVSKKEEPSIWFGNYYNSISPLNAYGRSGGKSTIVFHTGEVKALTNDFIKCKGGILVFNSPQEIDEMINAFSLDNMRKYIDDKNKKKDMLQ